MSKIDISEYIKELSEDIAISSVHHVEHYFPIDRFFIEKYNFLEKIKEVNPLEFLLCNLERVSNNYTNQLLLCLPELWEDVEYEDILMLIENFTNSFSFYSLVEFTYKYLEIDLLDEVFNNPKVDDKFKKDSIDYFPKIVATFYLDEDDLFEFDENLFGIQMSDWNYTKQRLLADKRIKPAIEADSLLIRLKGFEKTFK